MKFLNFTSRIVLLMVLVFAISGLYAQDCPSNLISFWKLNEEGASIFIDSESGHNATYDPVEDLPSDVDGKLGKAKSFDGTNRANVNYHSDFAFTNSSSFSIEFWAKFPAVASTAILVGANDDNAFWWVGTNTSGEIFFEILDGNAVTYELKSSSPSYDNDAWHHVVAVRNGSTDDMILYLDGSLSNSNNVNFTGAFPVGSDINFGHIVQGSVPQYHFTGILDEIAIYDKALSPTEVSAHYTDANQGLGICDPDSPVIYSTAVTTAIINSPYSYQVKATGKPTIHFYLDAAPAGMTIDEFTGVISWTPTSYVDATVTVRASSSFTPDDTQTFQIYIAEEPECPTGMLGLWHLDESTGPDYIDSYGIRDGVASVSPTATGGVVTGKNGQLFNGSAKIDLTDPDADDGFDWWYNVDFSIEFWIKTNVTQGMVAVGRHRTEDGTSGDPHADTLAKWWIGLDGSGAATFFLQDNGNRSFEITDLSATNLADNGWHQIVAVRKGTTQDILLYVDGGEVASELSTDYGNSFVADDPTPITVGYWDRLPGDDEYNFEGVIDEVAIFNKALTPSEVSESFGNKTVGYCAPGNYAPVITSTPSTLIVEQNDTYTYTFIVDDIDNTGAELLLSAVDKPDWLAFNYTPGQKQAVLTGIPGDGDVGTTGNEVILRVNDGSVSVDQEFTIEVIDVNDPPIIDSLNAPLDVDEDDEITLVIGDFAITDPDNAIGELTLFVQDGDNYTHVGNTVTPVADYNGTLAVIVMVSDPTNDSEDYSASITVNPVNDPPTVTSEPGITAKVNQQYIYLFTATDIDGDDVTLSSVELPEWLEFSESNGVLAGTPAEEDLGQNLVVLRASDGELNTDTTWIITVLPADGIEDISNSGIDIYPIPASNEINFRFEALDQDTYIHIITTTGVYAKSAMVNAKSESFTLQVNDLEAGIYYIIIGNSDNQYVTHISIID